MPYKASQKYVPSTHACITNQGTCRTQVLCSQTLLIHEGILVLNLLPNDICRPARLCQLDVSSISQHNECDRGKSTFILQLCVQITDSLGKKFSIPAELPLDLNIEVARKCNYKINAYTRLIHAQEIAPDAFKICTQIILKQTYLPCTTAAVKNTPIYPKPRCQRNGDFC